MTPRDRPGRRPLAALALGAVILAAVTACTSTTSADDGPAPTGATGGTARTGATATSGTGLIPPDTDATGTNPTDSTDGSTPAAPPGPPAAAGLAWLDGAQATVGIVTGDGAVQRWTGRRAGEHAQLGDGWYRYFGPDGSLVGCTSAGACVGVGADDTVAIVEKPGAAREIYTADGTYLGRYSSDGDRLPAVASPVEFREALARSGVDLSGLVDAATRDAPFAGGAMGDPHVITRGGQRYTTQAVGQFEARAGGDGPRIQVQFSPMAHRSDVSLISAVGIGAGETAIVFDLLGALTVNGETRLRVTDFTQAALADGVVLGQWPGSSDEPGAVVVVWPDGGSVAVTADRALGMTVVAHLYPDGSAGGIFGAETVRSGPDLVTRSGKPASVAGGIPAALASWQVPQSGRLLPAPTEPVGGLSDEQVAIDPGALKTAQRLCGDAGLVRSQDVAACAIDVGVTGDTGFLPQHLAVVTASTAPAVPPGFARRWPALQVSAVAGGTDLPSGGVLSTALAPGGVQVYRVTLSTPGRLSLRNETACSAANASNETEAPGGDGSAAGSTGSSPSGMDQAAWRLFDADGRPVSSRLALCGTGQVDHLAAGDYLLALGNGVDQAGESSDPLEVRATVTIS